MKPATTHLDSLLPSENASTVSGEAQPQQACSFSSQLAHLCSDEDSKRFLKSSMSPCLSSRPRFWRLQPSFRPRPHGAEVASKRFAIPWIKSARSTQLWLPRNETCCRPLSFKICKRKSQNWTRRSIRLEKNSQPPRERFRKPSPK